MQRNSIFKLYIKSTFLHFFFKKSPTYERHDHFLSKISFIFFNYAEFPTYECRARSRPWRRKTHLHSRASGSHCRSRGTSRRDALKVSCNLKNYFNWLFLNQIISNFWTYFPAFQKVENFTQKSINLFLYFHWSLVQDVDDKIDICTLKNLWKY